MRAWTAPEFLRHKFERPSWVLPGLVGASGWTMVLALPKTGKSIFCLQMALALAKGVPFLKWTPERSWRVTFVEWDAPVEEFQTQLFALDSAPPLSEQK